MKFPDPARAIEEQDEDVLLAMLVWGEARGESAQGRLAVAHVPLTRLARRRESGKKGLLTLREQILSPFQFSCFNANDPNRGRLVRPVESDGLASWVACWTSAMAALMGRNENPVPGATHYVVSRLWSRPTAVGRRPRWYEEPCIRSGKTKFIGVIGKHTFARTA